MRPVPTAVIFDLDGTIADTEKVHTRSIVEVCTYQGVNICATDLELGGYLGYGYEYTFTELIKIYGQFGEVASLVEATKTAFVSYASQSCLMPHAHDMLNGLRVKHPHVPLALTTGSWQTAQEALFKHLDLDQYFSVVITQSNYEKNKPDPEPYQKTMRQIYDKHRKQRIQRFIAIEDTPVGIQSASKAGCCVIAVEHSCSQEALLNTKPKPDIVFPSLDYVRDCLYSMLSP